MKRIVSAVSAALFFVALALVLFQPGRAGAARAADIFEKCEDCVIRNDRQFQQCQAVHGMAYQRCYDDYNEGVVFCYRQFCEQ